MMSMNLKKGEMSKSGEWRGGGSFTWNIKLIVCATTQKTYDLFHYFINKHQAWFTSIDDIEIQLLYPLFGGRKKYRATNIFQKKRKIRASKLFFFIFFFPPLHSNVITRYTFIQLKIISNEKRALNKTAIRGIAEANPYLLPPLERLWPSRIFKNYWNSCEFTLEIWEHFAFIFILSFFFFRFYFFFEKSARVGFFFSFQTIGVGDWFFDFFCFKNLKWRRGCLSYKSVANH